MFNIDDFLIKFKKLTIPDETTRKIFSSTIFNILNININIKDISLKNNIIYIKTTQISKNEIFINKTKILKQVEKQLKNKTPKNIL